MVPQLKEAVGRFRKLEVLYLVICLCLQFINDVSTTDSFPKNTQSSVQNKDSSHEIPNHFTKQRNHETDEKTLSRKSRATPELELSSMFSDDSNEADANRKGSYQSEDSLESSSEQENAGSNYAKKTNEADSFMTFPRIGKSKVDPNLIMPYPDSWLIPYLTKAKIALNEMNIPVPEVEEEFESSEYFSEESNDEDLIIEEDVLMPDNEEIQFDLITERQVDSNGTVIPYPRLGKRHMSISGEDMLKFNQNPSTRVKRQVDSIIPQMRFGRSNKPEKLSKQVKYPLYILPNVRPGRSSNSFEKDFKYDKSTKQGILPYPRPGRSDGDYILPQPRFGRSFAESKDVEQLNMFLKLNPSKSDKLPEELLKSGESQLFLIPYPRPGKRFFGTKPLPPNVNSQVKDKEYVSSEETEDKGQIVTTFLVPYPRPGRSENSNQYLIPNVRFGKSVSENMIPLPRYGRSSSKNHMIPYPRPGRSTSMIPQARFGRSNILPYPRPGRSSSLILPYPRLGRSSFSTSIFPQMRVGKSIIPQMRVGKSIIPQMRVGKSASVIPQMRVGKSSSVIPQMRVGKSASVIPQMRVGKSASIIPQMRVGKSASVIPQMRVGKSASVIPQMRVGKSASIIPQMRVGKSTSIIPQMRVGKSSSSSSVMDVLVDDYQNLLLQGMPEINKLDNSEDQIEQLRESSDNPNGFQVDSNSNILKSTVLIPAKKLQKHMLAQESNYMLPYPRPGRFV